MSSQKGRGGMGSRKHGVSGHTTKSPKLRHFLKREAEKDVRRKKKTITVWFKSVQEAFSIKKKPLPKKKRK